MNPACSPEADRVLASHVEGRDQATIVVVGTDGSIADRLTAGDEVALAPSWSGDGTRIVFYSVREGESALYAMDADGSERRRIGGGARSSPRPCGVARMEVSSRRPAP